MMALQGEDSEIEGFQEWHEAQKGEGEVGKTEEMTISLNATEGNETGSTVTLIGQYKSWQLVILVDNGSNHSFMDAWVAAELKVPLAKVPHIEVTVADGRKMKSHVSWFHLVGSTL